MLMGMMPQSVKRTDSPASVLFCALTALTCILCSYLPQSWGVCSLWSCSEMSLGALLPQAHPLTAVTGSCAIPHQSLLESNTNSLCSSAHVEHHSTTMLSLELVPDLNCDVLQKLHFLGFLFILEFKIGIH